MSVLEELLERAGITAAELDKREAPKRRLAVPHSAEFQRILNLPRRQQTVSPELVQQLTEAFRQPHGTMTLRPTQALALKEMYECEGLFGPIRVGGGKTLITYLSPCILDAKRPLLLLPAKLRDKTKREFTHLARDWQGPNFYRIESYELLGRPQASDILDRYRPDLIVADECHKLKSTHAAVTKRISRFFRQYPDTKLVALSGTITKRSLKDYAHLLRWSLRRGSPLPLDYGELELWAAVLDEVADNYFEQVEPGALYEFCSSAEMSKGKDGLREGFQRRLMQTAGVVATQEAKVSAELTLKPYFAGVDTDIDKAFVTLRKDWELPDGHPLADGLSVWRHARELGLGFYYHWVPEPPRYWLEARKAWASRCREILKANRRNLDSEAQVAQAVDNGWYPGEELSEWREVRDSYTYTTEAVWISNQALDLAAKWLSEHKGICWVEHVEFGKKLSRMTGLPFYGQGGLSDNGQRIEIHRPGYPLIASLLSNQEGRNLQAWSTSLVVSAPTTGTAWEQLLGRTHREGQTSKTVDYWVYLGCLPHLEAAERAINDANYVKLTTGADQKLLYSDNQLPGVGDFSAPGAQWLK